MIQSILNTPLARELSDLFYEKLKSSPNRELSFHDILDILDEKAEYGLARVSAGGIVLVKEKEDVEQVKDNKGRTCLRLIK